MSKGIYRRPQWHKDKGIKLIRVGGLSHVRQTNSAAPKGCKKGLWAFIWPYFDWWFVSGSFSQHDGRPKDKNQWRKHTFWYKGDIFTRIDLQKTAGPGAGTVWDDRWVLTDDRRLHEAMSKTYAADLKFIKKLLSDWKEEGKFTGNPYFQNCCSTDHFEVFIPRRKKVRR
jgi:hypothetical protein